MNVSERIIHKGFQHILDSKKVNTCYMLDDDGREIQITTAMIRSVCHQLLKQCRTIKK